MLQFVCNMINEERIIKVCKLGQLCIDNRQILDFALFRILEEVCH